MVEIHNLLLLYWRVVFNFFYIYIFSLPNLAKFPYGWLPFKQHHKIEIKENTLYCSTLAGLTLIILFVEMLNPIFFLWRIWTTWWPKKKNEKSECDFHKGFFFEVKCAQSCQILRGEKKPSRHNYTIGSSKLPKYNRIIQIFYFPSQMWLIPLCGWLPNHLSHN